MTTTSRSVVLSSSLRFQVSAEHWLIVGRRCSSAATARSAARWRSPPGSRRRRSLQRWKTASSRSSSLKRLKVRLTHLSLVHRLARTRATRGPACLPAAAPASRLPSQRSDADPPILCRPSLPSIVLHIAQRVLKRPSPSSNGSTACQVSPFAQARALGGVSRSRVCFSAMASSSLVSLGWLPFMLLAF